MARSVIAATLSVVFTGVVALVTAPLSVAQGQTENSSANTASGSANAMSGLTDAQLGDLVGRIALYPDDLLALILPASTVPLEIVQAQRFLKQAKGQKNPQPPDSLSEPVRNLLNYPEIIDQMNADLDWTQRLGEAVYDDQEAVMDAVQRFRMMAYSAGNLKSDSKQKIEVNNQTIIIEPAKPDVIYVPRYEPTTVIYASTSPTWNYWPTPYPVYYYPYPPGYTFASGFFWGATTAWAFNWHTGGIGWGNNWHSNTNINIDRNTTINRNTNINRYGGESGTWSPKHTGYGNSARPGDAGFKPNIDHNSAVKGANQVGASGRSDAGKGNRAEAGSRSEAGKGNRVEAGNRSDVGKVNRAETGSRPDAGKGNRAVASTGSSSFTPTTRPAARPSSSTGSHSSSSDTTRLSNSTGSRPSASGASRSAGNSSSRSASPQASSYGGMSGQQSRAASQRGNMSRSGGGHRGDGGHRR
ncbi:DUF3300 domain-containing protein [Alcaligenaceae bacterium]|nr:DUF3300 domain-containing protein [Alcaligenaceae bacterium]